MAVIIDEVTAEVQAPPPVSGASTGGRERPNEVDPVEVVRLMERLAERAARLEAD